jgi:deoxycytidine triphosphate deaminase
VLLSDADLRKELESGRLVLDPWDPAMLQPSSVDVRLDRFFRVFQNSRYTHIDPMQQQDELTTEVEPEGDDPFVLHPGEFVLGSTFEAVSLPDDLAGRLEGKALAIGTPVPTVAGWRTMGSLRVGDQVFGHDGRPTTVVAATEIVLGRPCFEVCFSDGQTIIADAAHLWRTTSRSARKHGRAPRIVTTAEIATTLRVGAEWNHHVELGAAAQYPEQVLPIDPYVLGVWLGDGTSGTAEVTVGHGDEQADKLVPSQYLEAAEHQRLSLLQGLMDSDGYIDEFGRCEFVSIRECLSDAVVELAASLGLRPVKRKKAVNFRGVEHGVAYQVKFTPRIPVFRLERKLARLKTGPAHRHRAITAVRPVASYPVRCVQVAAPDGMFRVGRTYIPTHNSSLGRLGLLTHSTAGFIDPGFSGHITLELSNVANLPITLWPGMKIGQLCLFRLSTPAERPYGSQGVGSRYQGQRGPTASRAHVNFHRVDTRRP